MQFSDAYDGRTHLGAAGCAEGGDVVVEFWGVVEAWALVVLVTVDVVLDGGGVVVLSFALRWS